jgi:hypothetical protein
MVGVVAGITQPGSNTHEAATHRGYDTPIGFGGSTLVHAACDRSRRMRWWIVVALSDLVRWLKHRWDYDTDLIDLIDCYKDYERAQNGKK